jgi:hypothetical protein
VHSKPEVAVSDRPGVYKIPMVRMFRGTDESANYNGSIRNQGLITLFLREVGVEK